MSKNENHRNLINNYIIINQAIIINRIAIKGTTWRTFRKVFYCEEKLPNACEYILDIRNKMSKLKEQISERNATNKELN